MNLPDYVDCQNEEVTHCDFYILKICPETCNYALDNRGLGVGAMMVPGGRQSDKNIETEVGIEILGEYFK